MTFKYSPTNRPKPTLKFFIEDDYLTVSNVAGVHAYTQHAYTQSQSTNLNKPVDEKRDFQSNSNVSVETQHKYDTVPTTTVNTFALSPKSQNIVTKTQNCTIFPIPHKPIYAPFSTKKAENVETISLVEAEKTKSNHRQNRLKNFKYTKVKTNQSEIDNQFKITNQSEIDNQFKIAKQSKIIKNTKIAKQSKIIKNTKIKLKPKEAMPLPNIIKHTKTFNQSVIRTPDGQLIWDHQEHYATQLYNIRYGVLPSRLIYNLASPELVVRSNDCNNAQIKKYIASVYINRFNEEIGFYEKLEKSILEEGIRNPILVTAGYPKWGSLEDVDPQYLQTVPSDQWLFCEFLGGSRLYISQKNDWLVPVLISDWTGNYSYFKQIKTLEELADCFMDPPNYAYFTARGLRTTPPKHVHLDTQHQDPRLLSEIRRNILTKDLKNV